VDKEQESGIILSLQRSRYYQLLREAGLNPRQLGAIAFSTSDNAAKREFYVCNDDLNDTQANPFFKKIAEIATVCGDNWNWQTIVSYLRDTTKDDKDKAWLGNLVHHYLGLGNALADGKIDGQFIIENGETRFQRLA
jgi:hypothetical protein